MLISHGARNLISDRVRQFFGGSPCHVQAAALPWRENSAGGVEIMLITSRGSGRWVLPKGWPEGDEHLSDAAAREAAEEAGLSGEIGRAEAGRFFYGKALRTGAERRCEVLVYPLKVASVAADWPEKGERQRRWFSPPEAARAVDEADLGELIAAFDG